jgi:DNA-binding MarR family transcriptional regulator
MVSSITSSDPKGAIPMDHEKSIPNNCVNILRLLSQRRPDGPKNAWEGPVENTQPELALALGVVRSAISHPLSLLKSRNLIQVHQLHTGGKRRRNVYFLTTDGNRYLQSIDHA